MQLAVQAGTRAARVRERDLAALLDGSRRRDAEEGALELLATRERLAYRLVALRGEQQRERRRPLAQVGAGDLAGLDRHAGAVEDVVGDLEGDAEREPERTRAAGDYLFARAFAELSAVGDAAAVATLANATLCLARGEAMQRRQRFDPDTSVDAYLERCMLKTGKLFEAACRLAGGPGAFGLALGVAFQITDDILDCSGVTIETGKIAGTDLREGTPTLPLLLAAQRDEAVREALAGGPQLEGALLRVASTGAIEESREVALAYARSARACLNGELHREELEALTYAVVNRER